MQCKKEYIGNRTKKKDEQVKKIIINSARYNVELPNGKGGRWPTIVIDVMIKPTSPEPTPFFR